MLYKQVWDNNWKMSIIHWSIIRLKCWRQLVKMAVGCAANQEVLLTAWCNSVTVWAACMRYYLLQCSRLTLCSYKDLNDDRHKNELLTSFWRRTKLSHYPFQFCDQILRC